MTYREQIGHPETCQCAGCADWDQAMARAKEYIRLGQANQLPAKQQADYDHSMAVAMFGGHFSERW